MIRSFMTGYGQRLSAFLLLALYSLTLFVGTVSAAPANVPVPSATRFEQITNLHQATVIWSEVQLAIGGDCYLADVTSEYKASGQWYGGRIVTAGFPVESTDGKVNCNNSPDGKRWLIELLSAAGLTPAEAANTMFSGNYRGNITVQISNMKSILGPTLFNTSVPATTPDHIKWAAWFNTFTSPAACNAQPTSDNSGTDIWVYDEATNAVKQVKYKFDDKAVPVMKAYGGGGDSKLECRNIANNLSQRNYAEAVKTWIGVKGASATIGNVNGQVSGVQPSCENKSVGFGIAWLMCGLIRLLDGAITTLDSQIQGLLTIDRDQYDNAQVHKAWSVIRNFALLMLVPLMLLMVIGTAIEIGPFDAYTVRKALPRMLIGILFIVLSYPILTFFIELTNAVGLGTLGLITSAFGHGGEQLTLASLLNPSGAQAGGLFAAGIAGLWAAPIDLPIAFMMALTVVGGLAIGFVALIIRQIIIVGALIVAPIAILDWAAGNGNLFWKIWKETFSKLLIFFPIIMVFIASGRAFASIVSTSNAGIFGFIFICVAYIGPYFAFKAVFGFAGVAFSTLTGAVNNRSKGYFDRLSNARGERMKNNVQQTVQGTNRKGRKGGIVGGLYRRGALANQGGLSVTRGGRAQYKAAKQSMFDSVAEEGIKRDNGRFAGDDIATKLALKRGMSDRTFVKDYAAEAIKQATKEDGTVTITQTQANQMAVEALGGIKAGFGPLGSVGTRKAAFRSRAASNTGYVASKDGDGTDMYQAIYADAAEMVNDGLMTSVDAAVAVKSNRGRADQNSSFAATLTAINEAAANKRAGVTGDVLSSGTVEELRKSAFGGADTGAIFSGHKNTVISYAKYMASDGGKIDQVISSGKQDDIEALAAEVAGRFDAINSASPEKAEAFSAIMAKEVPDGTGNTIPLRQYINSFVENRPGNDQGASKFLDLRKKWGDQTTYQMQQAAREAAGGGQPQTQPTGGPQGGSGPR